MQFCTHTLTHVHTSTHTHALVMLVAGVVTFCMLDNINLDMHKRMHVHMHTSYAHQARHVFFVCYRFPFVLLSRMAMLSIETLWTYVRGQVCRHVSVGGGLDGWDTTMLVGLLVGVVMVMTHAHMHMRVHVYKMVCMACCVWFGLNLEISSCACTRTHPCTCLYTRTHHASIKLIILSACAT